MAGLLVADKVPSLSPLTNDVACDEQWTGSKESTEYSNWCGTTNIQYQYLQLGDAGVGGYLEY